jgi:hypothetical protein
MMARSPTLQPKAGYIDARPPTANSTKFSCNARPDHTLGSCMDGARGARGNLTFLRSSGAVMYSASHDGISRQELMWADGDPRRSSHFCRLPCKTSHPAGVDPNHCPAFGTGELQENGTTLYRRRRSAMPNNGDVPSDRWTALRSQRNPDCWVDQAAVLKTAPSGTTPSMTNLHSAISSFRARATTMILRTRGPVDPTRSRNQQT